MPPRQRRTTQGGFHAVTQLIGLIMSRCLPGLAQAQVPAAIAAPGETVVATWHAEGAQVYECKAGADGKLAWAFREPIATLMLDGKTIGRHYAGPNWEHMDGSAMVGKVAGNAPAPTPKDIPWLKLEVVASRGSGALVRRHHGAADQHRGRRATRAPATRPAPSTTRPTRPTTCS